VSIGREAWLMWRLSCCSFVELGSSPRRSIGFRVSGLWC
jgi:hypothetical protein